MTKRVGIDTCVVLRLLTGVPEDQAHRAQALLNACARQGTCLLVSDLVVAEAYHALIYYYEVPKKTAVETLRSFLLAPGVHPTGNAPGVLAAYHGTGAGLVDRLIQADYRRETAHIVSFDHDFCRLDGVQAL